MKVFCRVFVRRGIAATDVTAFETKPQVQPMSADFETIFTALSRIGFVGVCVFEMLTSFHIVFLILFFDNPADRV